MNLEDRSAVQQSPIIAGNRPRAALHLVLGPVGAGKSTFARGLARDLGAVRLTLDEWMSVLFRPDRPDGDLLEWYAERAERCVEQIWRVTRAVIAAGTPVVLEIGLIRRNERQGFYARATAVDLEPTIHVIDAARDIRRARVEERNRVQGQTFSMVVPPAIFELASDLWEPLDASECVGRDVRFLHTDA
jgi:predicted kinase